MDFKNLKSIRVRLTLWYVLILGVLLISFSTFLYFTLSKSLERDVDKKLRSLAELIAEESVMPLSKFGFNNIERTLEDLMNLKPIGKFIQVLDESGRVGNKSENLKNIELPITINALKNASRGIITFETIRSIGNTPLRIITYPAIDQNHPVKIIQVASSLEEVEDALNKLFIILIITVPMALIVAVLGGQFLANKALKPVDQITQTARLITSKNLNQRISPLKVKDEIGRLIDTFNDMISRLDQSFQKIKQFTQDVSHELKTPLTILKGEVEVGLLKDRSTVEYQRILKSNLEEINRMSQIIEDLLLLSKVDSGEIKLQKQEVNLNKIIYEVVSQMEILAKDKGLRIEIQNYQQDVILFGDSLKLRELFLNLISNSIKYTEQGGVIRITIKREAQNGLKNRYAKIIVSDTGIGISKEDQPKIFDRFYRVDKARSREQGGSGLGLSICKWIVEAHNGEIKVESELGKGSSFIVNLPINLQG